MPRIKLVLADMDGTLVPFGADGVSPRTMAAIARMREVGIAFGPSSGRERVSLIDSFHGVEACVATGIASNGKVVYVDGSIVSFRPLPRGPLQELLVATRGLPGVVLVCYPPVDGPQNGVNALWPIGASRDEMAFLLRGEREAYLPVRDDLPEGSITTVAVLVQDEVANVDETYRALSRACPQLSLVRPAPSVFDVLEPGWSKLSALPLLQEALGVERDEIAYFGDSQNDLTMMEAIPHSFCMGNGTPEAKAAARWVIDTDADDGAALVMESLARHGGELVPGEWLP